MITPTRFFASPVQADVVAKSALACGACGLLSTVPVSSALQGVLLLVFMLAGPGSAAMCWVDLPPAVTVAAVIGVSVATVFALSVAMAWLGWWLPVPSCLLLSVLAITSGLLRLRALRRTATGSRRPW
jgi:CHASE2 domain-containing sensor protein